jgi:hypothetical protein
MAVPTVSPIPTLFFTMASLVMDPANDGSMTT